MSSETRINTYLALALLGILLPHLANSEVNEWTRVKNGAISSPNQFKFNPEELVIEYVLEPFEGAVMTDMEFSVSSKFYDTKSRVLGIAALLYKMEGATVVKSWLRIGVRINKKMKYCHDELSWDGSLPTAVKIDVHDPNVFTINSKTKADFESSSCRSMKAWYDLIQQRAIAGAASVMYDPTRSTKNKLEISYRVVDPMIDTNDVFQEDETANVSDDVTADITADATDDTADDAIDDTTDNAIDDTTDDAADDEIDDVIDDTADDTIDDTTDDTTDDTNDDTTDDTTDNTTDDTTDDTTDEATVGDSTADDFTVKVVPEHGEICSIYPLGVLDTFKGESVHYDLNCFHVLAADVGGVKPWFIYGNFDDFDGKRSLGSMTFYLGADAFEVQRGWLINLHGEKYKLTEGVTKVLPGTGCEVLMADLHLTVDCRMDGYPFIADYDGYMVGHIELTETADRNAGLCFGPSYGRRVNWQIFTSGDDCSITPNVEVCQQENSMCQDLFGNSCDNSLVRACEEMTCGSTASSEQLCSLSLALSHKCALTGSGDVATDDNCPADVCLRKFFILGAGCPQDSFFTDCPIENYLT